MWKQNRFNSWKHEIISKLLTYKAMDHMEIKPDRSFFQAAVVSILLYGCTAWMLKKTAGEEARRQLHKNVASNIEQVLEATRHKTPTIRPPASHHENYPS